ncbi:MAG: hypothetical protein RIR91_819 [Verrucomicrobiota bacterium]
MLAQRAAVQKLLKDAGFAESEIVFSASDVTRLEPAVFPEFAPTQDGVRTPIQRAPVDFNRFARGKVPEFALAQSFSIETPESKQELLEAAAKDAQRRAATMVAGSGSKVGALLDASQGVIQICAKDRVGESDANSIDFYSIEKTIRVVVTMRFEIVKE